MFELGAYPYSGWVLLGLGIYMMIMIGIGWWCSTKVKTASDYIVAGRRLPFFYATGTLFATWFCAGTLMGGTANAYLFGNQGVIFDPWGAALCLVLTGLLFARMMRRGGYMTLVDFFEIRYGSTMGLLSTVVLAVAEIGWVGAQLVAFGTIIQVFSGLPLAYGIIISCLVLIIYTYMGGMWSVTLTDVVQMVILTVGVVLLFPSVITQVGGWAGFVGAASNWAGLPAFSMTVDPEMGYLGYTGVTGWMYYIAAWLAIGFGSIPAQDLMQRVLSAKDEKVAVHSSYAAGVLYIVVGMLPVLMGIAMFQINPELSIADTEMILPWLAMTYLPPVLTVIFVAGMVAALMSSSDSALLAVASVVGYNGLRYFNPNATEQQKLAVTRLMVPVAAVISLLLAIYAATIYKLMVIAWSVILVGLFAPYAAGYFWKKANKSGALAALTGGFLVWVASIYYYLPSTMEANMGVVEEGVVYMDWAVWDAVYLGSVPGFIASLVLLIAVSILTQKKDPPMALRDMDGNPLPLKKWLGFGFDA